MTKFGRLLTQAFFLGYWLVGDVVTSQRLENDGEIRDKSSSTSTATAEPGTRYRVQHERVAMREALRQESRRDEREEDERGSCW